MTLPAYLRAMPIDFNVPFHRAALVLLLALFFSMPAAARSVDTPLARFRNRLLYAADLAPTHLDLRRAPPESDVVARDKWLWEARADRLWERMDPLYREYAKRHRLEPTRAQFDSYVTALRRMSDEPISIRDIRDFARQAIRRHNIFRHLYREHGGRVIFQQFGPEPLDALHRFWLDHEAAGQFEIHSPELRQAFYNYFHIPHTVSSPRQGRLEMETPWWEMTDPTIIDWLRIRGIPARLTSGARPHHLRVVLGDDRLLLVGSHLWSLSGVSQYVQTSILIDSPEIGEAMSDYLESL